MKRKFATGWLCLLGLPALAIESPDAPAPIPPRAVPDAPAAAAPAPAPRTESAIPPVRPRRVIPEQAPEREREHEREQETETVRTAFLGVGGSAVPDLLADHLKLADGRGMVVNTLAPDGPAAKAGIVVNDIIMKVGDREVGSQEDLRDVIGAHQAGDEVSIDLIHRGEPRTVRLALGTAPKVSALPRARLMGGLDDLQLQGLPEEQARRIREDVERNLRAFENMDSFGLGDNPVERLAREAHRQLGRGLRGGIDLDHNGNGGPATGIDVKSTSTVRLLDDQGAVELRSEDGSKQVKAYDADGKLLWEGPYNTEEDKAKMPEDVRERVGKLNLDMNFKGGGLRFNMRPR